MANPKILLADDSIAIRKVIELTFADEGFDVTSVDNGDAAMEKFIEIEPDCLIADVHMPGMAGYQLCEMIKGDETTKDIPVVLVVGSFEPFDAGEASRVGANYYFTKPFQSIRDVVEKVSDLIAAKEFSSVVQPGTEDIEDLYTRSIVEEEDAPVEQEIDRAFDSVTAAEEEALQENAELVRIYDPVAEDDDDGIEVEKADVPENEPGDALAEDVAVVPGSDAEPATDEIENAAGSPEPQIAEPEAEARGPESDGLIRVMDDAAEDDALIETTRLTEPEPVAAEIPKANVLDPFEAVAGDAPEPAQKVKFAFDEVQAADADPENVWPDVEPSNARSAYPPELIEEIAQRVIDRLSAQAVRDAAREAVPRIAEKLIREALDQESRPAE